MQQNMISWREWLNTHFPMWEILFLLELCRRGDEVNIGKTADGEVDFVAQR
ncbi:MAG: hypothetical protein SO181_04265 [Frisingicoccus sp.]|uniref:hypothetical protein n=1 Tax=Frisingicoccus sp. TaxID=1918627 RepID=UPI002A80EB01|nr:hypothetical protein [Frisingicoccus sp.]MDY4834347.1 hypothetical protein [Frisingicoccus sp.]